MTVAEPIPPPAHIAATPIPPPRRRSSCTSVTSILAPVAATGCPSEQPLPLTLTRSGSRSEQLDGGHAHRGECLVDLEQVDVRYRKVGAGKRFRDRLDRGQSGGRGVDADRRPRPHGRQRRAGPSRSLAMVSTAAPSLAPQALPAVIEKPSISGCSGLSAANFSMLVSRRGCSSTANSPCGVSIGTISSLKRPSSMAAIALRCDRNAQASISSRLTPAWRQRRSSPTVIDMSMFGASGRSGCVGGNQSTHSPSTCSRDRGEVEAELHAAGDDQLIHPGTHACRRALHRRLTCRAVPVLGQAGHLSPAPRSSPRAGPPHRRRRGLRPGSRRRPEPGPGRRRLPRPRDLPARRRWCRAAFPCGRCRWGCAGRTR